MNLLFAKAKPVSYMLPKLEGGVVAGAVPEMKDLDKVGGFIDAIVDQDGGMRELADAGPPLHRATDLREAL